MSDGNGHGTHVAGTTGGKKYGVAKKTRLYAVKVLSAGGSGSTAGVIKGVEFSVNHAKQNGRIGKAVANMSLGGVRSQAMNQAVAAAVREGMFMAVAAGNSASPTFTASPASEPSVCTVGASDMQDLRAFFSNYGLLVDIYAPGVDIISAWIGGPDDTVSSSCKKEAGRDIKLWFADGLNPPEHHFGYINGFAPRRWTRCLPTGSRGIDGSRSSVR